jgi:2-methylcitrate dehydratase PrpD
MTLLEGKVGLAQLTPEKVNDPRIKALTKKVRLIPDPSIPAPPAQMRIEIVLKDGTRYKTEYQARRGTPSNPMTPDEILQKFQECVALTDFDMHKALEVHRMGLALEQVADFSSMATLLR